MSQIMIIGSNFYCKYLLKITNASNKSIINRINSQQTFSVQIHSNMATVIYKHDKNFHRLLG